MLQIIQILFLLIAILMVAWTFFPTWSMPPVVNIGRIIALLVGLVILYVVYLLVTMMLVQIA